MREAPIRALVTSCRFPYALGVIRALARAGHEVHVSECYERSAASFSRYAAGHVVTPPPIPEASAFVEAIADYSRRRSIDVIVPIFEEIFALAAMRDRLPAETRLCAAEFEVLAELHNKARFRALAERLGLRTPATEVVEDAEALREAVARSPGYVAKPAFSRAGTTMLTDVGPRAGERSIDEIEPSADLPWLVQEYVDGADVASLAVARGGRIAAYVAYEEPLQSDGGYSMRQRAIDAGPTLAIAARVTEHLGFDGFLGIDYRVGEGPPCVIECNPRCSPGAMLFEGADLARALIGEPPQDTFLVDPGTASQFDTAVASNAYHGVASIPEAIRELRLSPGALLDPRDPVADLAGWLRFHHDSRLATREHASFAEQRLRDVSWDGQPLAG